MKEIKEMLKDIDQKVDYIIDKISDLLYRH